MPIISEIGKRSISTRLLYGSIYLVLLIGSITMIYPLMLMLSGSVKSEADSWSIKPYPDFWFDDLVLFRKYTEAKYNVATQTVQQSWCKTVFSWRTIEKPEEIDSGFIEDLRNWRKSIPPQDRVVGDISGMGVLPKNLRSYQNYMSKKYKDDLDAYNQAANQLCTSLAGIRPPPELIGRYRNRNIPEAFRQELIKWRSEIPAEDLIVEGSRGHYALGYLSGIYTSRIEIYNKEHGTGYKSYGEIPFPDRAPPLTDGLSRKDWTNFVRNEIKLSSIRLDPSLEPSFRKYLEAQYESAAIFNKDHQTTFASIADIQFPEKIDDAPFLRQDFETFIKSPDLCPIEFVSIYADDEKFSEFMLKEHGKIPEGYPGLGRIVAATDWADCMENKMAVKWEFTMRNYLQVLGYIAMHGNGLLNTFIYCALAIACALIVNPLAAYALSRFKLPGTYKILLFCMATMAFPGEVTMIPGFLLLKRFPVWPILVGIIVMILSFLVLEKFLPRWKENWRSIISISAGLIAGSIIFPAILPEYATVSLLNTFAALVLPGIANGYFIFLLKGFFDSMPKELYEAADIDGASEWTKFWMLTMNLSKPILAVIALGAFTSAYSAFMMALIIIPDQKMWTIMVWIFQLQSQAHQSVVYASLVIAAIPTFMIFVLCQNVIMRGIVVPTEK